MGIKVEGVAPLIQVFDMPRSIAFYRDVVGFEIVTTSPPRDPELHLTDPDGYGICLQWRAKP